MTTPSPRREHPLVKIATELGPLVLFFVANARFDIYVATALFMAAIVVALAVSWIMTRHLPMMAIVSAVLVLVFGGLTLYLHDDTFIKMKPTIIYAMFAAVLIAGLMMGRAWIRLLFGSVFRLTDEGWRRLSWRWALFFVVIAVLNEIIWRTQSTDLWVTFKVFGVLPLTVLYGLAQYPLLRRHALPEEAARDSET